MKSEEFFREVDEELQRDRMAALWRRYGGLVIALAIAIVVGTAAGVGWKAWRERERQAEAARYETASEQVERDPAAAAAALDGVAKESSTGYGELARLREAEAKVAARDEAGAAKALDGLATEKGADPLLRDLAGVLAIGREIDAGGDPAALKTRLEPLAAAGAPFRFVAREMLALLAIKAGDTEGARRTLDDLSREAGLPQQQEQRVRQLLASLPRPPGAAAPEAGGGGGAAAPTGEVPKS